MQLSGGHLGHHHELGADLRTQTVRGLRVGKHLLDAIRRVSLR